MVGVRKKGKRAAGGNFLKRNIYLDEHIFRRYLRSIIKIYLSC